jgi:hypothetical protein
MISIPIIMKKLSSRELTEEIRIKGPISFMITPDPRFQRIRLTKRVHHTLPDPG